MWSLVMYSNCLEWDLSKEETVINLSAILLLTVPLHLILFITVSLQQHYKCDQNLKWNPGGYHV